jgi:predicted amidohydrolase
LEFEGMKGKAWLMKWLPARAYDNNIYAIFSNPVGMDDEQLKNGYSMIIDPFGDIIAECRSFDDCISTATIIPEKLLKSGGYRYINARRPELYKNILGKEHLSNQQVAWLNNKS